MSAPSGRRRRYVEVNTLNEGWRQTVREATDSSISNFSPSLRVFFLFFLFFLPPGLFSLSRWTSGGGTRQRWEVGWQLLIELF